MGYDTTAAAQLYGDRLRRLFPSDYPVLFWLRTLLDDVRSVFDFGGHVGIGYHAYQRVLDFPRDLTWTVCDVPAVVTEGERLAREAGATALRFTTDFAGAADAQLLLAAGSLQYVERTLAAALASLTRMPRHIIVNKTPTYAGDEFFTLQNIGVTFCPYRIAARDGLRESLAPLGYTLVDSWENPDLSCTIPFHEAHAPITYVGHYFRRDV